MRTPIRTVAVLLLGSGFASVAYQTVWLRELRLIFGSTTGATAAVIGLFMAGLGFGSLLLGKRADRSRNGLRLYADLELGISLAAALSPLLITAAGWLYFSTGGSPRLGVTGATIVRLSLAALCLGVPTFLMGGTLPAAARAVIRSDDLKRRSVATLYGANTLGAVVGVLLPTFFLLERLGNRLTLVLAVLINLSVAGLARFLSRSAANEPTAPSVSEPADASSPAPRRFVFVAAAVVGFVFLLMELVWYRMLAPILGGSTFTFGLILAVALLGIGIGGLLYGIAAGNRPASLRLFAWTCALEALAIAAPFAMGDSIATLALLLRQLSLFGFAGQVTGWSLICALVVLPAGIVSGFQFPLLIALLGQGRVGVGRDAGYAYAWNTLGAIGGSVAGGFGLLPLLTAPGAWRAAAVVMALLSLVSAALTIRAKERVAWTAAALAIGSLLLIALPSGPTPAWRHSGIGAGRASLPAAAADLIDMSRWQRRTIFWEAEGVESSIAMNNAAGIAFIVNGKADGHALNDAGTQVMGGLLGAMLHPRPVTSLVIGLGTGSSAGWLALVPGMERVDVAELEPAIADVAAACSPVNADVLQRSNVNLIYGDAREILLAAGDRYDIIFSEPSNPYRAGIASLFTKQFYAAAADRLQPGGLFLQWVQAYEITAPTLATIYRTLTEVFPHVQTWRTSAGDLLLIASEEEPAVDVAMLQRRVGEEPYRTALRVSWLVHDLEGVLAHHIANSAFPKALLATTWGDVNTDDRNSIEFGFARSVGTTGIDLPSLLGRARAEGFDRPRLGTEAVDWGRVENRRIRSAVIGAGVTPPSSDVYASNGQRKGDGTPSPAIASEGENPSISEMVAASARFAAAGDPFALELSKRLEILAPLDARAVRVLHFAALQRREEAERELAALLADLRRSPWITRLMMHEVFRVVPAIASGDAGTAERLRELLGEPLSMFIAEEERKQLVLQLSVTAERDTCGPLTLSALEKYEPSTPWNGTFLALRARCYGERGHALASAAKRELRTYSSQVPKTFAPR